MKRIFLADDAPKQYETIVVKLIKLKLYFVLFDLCYESHYRKLDTLPVQTAEMR